MPNVLRLWQNSFVGGEFGNDLYGRNDLDVYPRGLRKAQNVIIDRAGKVRGRPGTRFVGEVKDSSKAARITPFKFNTSTKQNYIHEWGDLTLRVVMEGGYVLQTNIAIATVTNASPGVFGATGHGLSVNDHVFGDSFGGMTGLDDRFYRVNTVPTADTFTLKDMYGTAINTTSMGTYTSGGTIARVYQAASPFADEDIVQTGIYPPFDFAQQNDAMYLTHLLYAPRKLTRSGHATWTFSTPTYGTAQAAPSNVAADVLEIGGDMRRYINYGYVVTAVSADEEESVASGEDIATGDLSREHQWNEIGWDAPGSGPTPIYYNVYRCRGGRIDSGAGTESTQFYGFIGETVFPELLDDNITADYTRTPPQAKNPFASSGNYPAFCAYHENRLWYGQTLNEPGGVWASKIGFPTNMNVAVQPRSTDAIFFAFLGAGNEVRGFSSIRGFAIFTAEQEFLAQPDSDVGAITPRSLDLAKGQTAYGSAPIKPIKISDFALFLERFGKKVRAFKYQFEADGFTSNDLTVFASHLFEDNSILSWAYAQSPHSLVLAVRDDGILPVMTAELEQGIFPWGRWYLGGTFGSGDSATGYGVVEDVAVIPSDDRDEIYLLVKRTVSSVTKRYIEQLVQDNWTDVADYWGLDCAKLYEGAATRYITGLHHLEGQTVAALINGALREGLTVTGGTVDLGEDVTGTKVLIGLQPLPPQIEPLPLDRFDPRSEATTGRKKVISHMVMRVLNSVGIKCGPNEEKLRPVKLRTTPSIVPYTGIARVQLDPVFSDDGAFVIQGTAGLPFTILSMHPDVVIGPK